MPPMVVLQKIKAPVEDVFNFVGNVTTHPRFADFCREVKITSEQSTGAGTRFHQVYEDSRECDSVIMLWEPFQKIVWHNFVGGGKKPAQIITYRFEQEGEIFDVPVTVTLNYRSGASEDIIVPVTDEITELRVPLAGQLRGVDVNRDRAALARIDD